MGWRGDESHGEGSGFKCRRAPSFISFLQLVGLVPGMGHLAPFRQDFVCTSVWRGSGVFQKNGMLTSVYGECDAVY